MKKAILFFLLFLLGYHILHTFLVYGVEVISPTVFAVLRDIVRLSLVGVILLIGRKYLKKAFLIWKRPLLCLVLLIVRSLLLSWQQGVQLDMMLVGLKYDVYPLVILMSSVLVGSIYKSTPTPSFLKEGRSGDSLSILGVNRISTVLGQRFLYVLLIILVGGLLWQIGKITFPDFFSWFGYGAVGDYVLGAHPPVWYRTGPGGMMRLQGLFSGPNNYGFFLVSFASMILYMSREVFFNTTNPPVPSQQSGEETTPLTGGTRWFMGVLLALYFVSLGWTLSRGAWIAVGGQVFLLVWLFRPQWKKYLWILIVLGILSLLAIAGLKSGSTFAHFMAWFQGRDAFLANPRGYGLASAGPAVHREGIYLPENHYLQILLDIGIPGLLLWLGVVGSVIYKVARNFKLQARNWTGQQVVIVLFMLGLAGLLVEGLFLHVFEDSMVNYLFFVPLGILVGSIRFK